MKILAICGSPHKGNSYDTLNTLKEIYHDVDIEIVMLKDLELAQCNGCYKCVQKG